MFLACFFIIYKFEPSFLCGNARPRWLPACISPPSPCGGPRSAARSPVDLLPAQQPHLWALNPINFLSTKGKMRIPFLFTPRCVVWGMAGVTGWELGLSHMKPSLNLGAVPHALLCSAPFWGGGDVGSHAQSYVILQLSHLPLPQPVLGESHVPKSPSPCCFGAREPCLALEP